MIFYQLYLCSCGLGEVDFSNSELTGDLCWIYERKQGFSQKHKLLEFISCYVHKLVFCFINWQWMCGILLCVPLFSNTITNARILLQPKLQVATFFDCSLFFKFASVGIFKQRIFDCATCLVQWRFCLIEFDTEFNRSFWTLRYISLNWPRKKLSSGFHFDEWRKAPVFYVSIVFKCVTHFEDIEIGVRLFLGISIWFAKYFAKRIAYRDCSMQRCSICNCFMRIGWFRKTLAPTFEPSVFWSNRQQAECDQYHF